MKKAWLSGYSDDCQNVWVEGQRLTTDEYTNKRLVLTLPDGQEITATLEFEDQSWAVNFDIPDGIQVRAEEHDEDWEPVEQAD